MDSASLHGRIERSPGDQSLTVQVEVDVRLPSLSRLEVIVRKATQVATGSHGSPLSRWRLNTSELTIWIPRVAPCSPATLSGCEASSDEHGGSVEKFDGRRNGSVVMTVERELCDPGATWDRSLVHLKTYNHSALGRFQTMSAARLPTQDERGADSRGEVS